MVEKMESDKQFGDHDDEAKDRAANFNANNNESDDEGGDSNEEDVEGESKDDFPASMSGSGDGVFETSVMPSLAFDPMNPAMITLLERADVSAMTFFEKKKT